MSLVWHQIKKDGWRLRWLLVLWAVLVALQSGLLMASALVAQGWAVHLAYKLVAMVLPLLQFLLLIVIVPLLVHEEPLVGTTAAWFTRPLSRGTLLASKAAFVFVVLVLAPLAAEMVALGANDASGRELGLAAAEIALTQWGVVAAVAALAALTPNFARFMTWGAVVWTVQTLAASAMMVRFMLGGTDDLLEWAAQPGAFRASMLVSLGSAVVAGTAVVVHQYLTRRTRRSVVFAICGLVASLVLSVSGAWLRPRRAEAATASASAPLSLDSDSVFAVDAFSIHTVTPPRKKISAQADCARSAPAAFCEIDELRGTLKYADGGVVPVERARGFSLPRVHKRPLEQALGGATLVTSGLVDLGTDLFEVEQAVYTQRGRTPAVLEGNATVTLKRYRVVATLPLRRGAFHAAGADRVTITDVLRGPGTCQVLLLHRRLRLLLSDQPGSAPSLAAGLLGPVSHVLVNAERRQAFVPEFMPSFNFGETLSQMMPGGQRVSNDPASLMFTSESRFEKRPKLDDAWLDGASLVLVAADEQGHADARVAVPDFFLARSEMPRDYVRTWPVEDGLTPAQYYERGAARLEDGLGYSLDDGRALSQAKAYFTKAVQGDPDLAAAYAGLALVAAATDGPPAARRNSAKVWMEKAGLAGADPTAQRVEAYLLDAQQGDAVAVMERVVTQSPNVAAYWRDLGYFRGKAWHLRRAAEAFDRALETQPDPIDAARVQAQRGQSYFVVSRSAEARAAFEKAVALRPDYAPYWAQLCEARLAAGECHTARDAARQSRGVASNWTAQSCLVRADICLGQVDEGSDEIKGASGWDLVAIGDFFRSRGDEAKARAAYERAQLPPEDTHLALSLSDLELRAGGAAKAWPALQPALTNDPRDPDLLAQAAVLHFHGGEHARALEAAGQALEARLDGQTLKRLDRALGQDSDYLRRRVQITTRVNGLFEYYERKHDYQYLRRDIPMTEWVLGHAGATHKDPEAVPHLIRYLQESAFAETRARAADALWIIGDRSAVPALLAALSDSDLKVQGFAASGLGDLGDATVVDPLLDLFQRLPDNREETKARIADALGKLGDKRALSPIRESLAKIQDPGYVRWARPAANRLEAAPEGPR
jgi:tetratricopeptide (TPR) repeat protein